MRFAVIILIRLSSFSFVFCVQRISYTRVKSVALLETFLNRSYDIFQWAGIGFFMLLRVRWSDQARTFSIEISRLQSRG